MTRARHAVVVSVTVLALAGHVRPAWGEPAARPAPPEMAGAIEPEALEAIYGVRVTRVAVTGGGGLVDLRFTIVDAAKARPLLQGHAASPRLVVAGSGAVLEGGRHGMRSVRLEDAATSFLLYPNARNAVRPGTRVAVAFGDVLMQPVVVR